MSDLPVHSADASGSSGGRISPAEALAALREIVAAAGEFHRDWQNGQTKRAAIAGDERLQIARIQAAEEILRLYFERAFAERERNSEELFVRLDQAMETQDPQMVHAVVRGIVDLAQASPLSGLEDFGRFWAELGTGDNPVEL